MPDQIRLVIPIPKDPGALGETPDDCLWADRITPTTARLLGIPEFERAYSWGDVVEFDQATRTVLKVVTKRSRLIECRSEPKGVTRDGWVELCSHLYRGGAMSCDVPRGRLFLVAVPIDMSEPEFQALLSSCPLSVEMVQASPEWEPCTCGWNKSSHR